MRICFGNGNRLGGIFVDVGIMRAYDHLLI